MLKPEIEKILNEQVAIEFAAANAYLSMASWAESKNLADIAAYLYAASEDERMHGLEMFKYINANGGVAVAPEVKAARKDYSNFLELFEHVYQLEHNNTLAINKIADTCMKSMDYATFKFMEKFVLEQQEAERSVSQLLHIIKTLGYDDRNLYFLNKTFKKINQGKIKGNTDE